MRAVLLSLLTLLPIAGARAEEDVRSWFDRAVQAVERLNYEVLMVFARDDRLQTLQVLHSYDSGRVRERIEALNGSPREVVRLDGRVACSVGGIHVLTGRGHGQQGMSLGVHGDLDALRAWYAFSLGDTDRIAGRPCRTLRIEPRDRYRYGYRLCLDQEVGLPLRTEILDHDHRVLERMIVTRLVLYREPLPAERFMVDWSRAPTTAEQEDEVPPESGPWDTHWEIGELPPGYAVVERDRYPMREGAVSVEHLVASDGLAAVSVFVRPEDEELFRGLKRSGAMHVFGLLHPPYHVTVMGEVPAVVVRMIGDSVHPVREGGE